ncbi:MAG: FAD-binding oxidoreductase [Candidatus Eisenbacteria bacterium]|nr:FAD-binding oxidoreductase [Candidatus Eisenbacteria bacterium]
MASIRIMTLEGGFFEPSPEVLAAFRAQLRGALLVEGDAGYEDSRSLWNAMIDRRPAAVVRALGTADVIACVNFARQHSLVLTLKGGGHNIAGLAVRDAGLMLDLSLMRGVWVDERSRLAHAQAGCLLGDVDRETQLHGLAAVLGFVSNTGIAGLTLGGGFGYLSRRFGWTTDNVRSMQVVTADGQLVRASELENPDLFWGLRGGGGNFGVVTDFEYELHPVGPEVVGGAIAWPAENAPAVLELFRTLMSNASPELALVAAMRLAPPAPWIRKDAHGKPIVVVFVCHTGTVEQAERDLAPLKGFGAPVGDIVQRRTYVSQQNLLDATQPKGRRYYWKSEYLPALGTELFEKYREHAARIVSPHSAVILFPLGGAVGRHGEDHSPAGNRDAQWVLNISGSWDRAEDDAANMEWARAAWRDMRAFSTGGTYVNFLNAEENDDRTRDAYRGNYDRLARVKARWDPANLFRSNKNIVAAG